MRVLTYTTLYPNSERPRHGIFVESRLKHLRSRHPVQQRVVAPVPWFPSASPRFGEYARHARVPTEELRGGIPVTHPRYPVIPRVGMNCAPYLLYFWTLRSVQRLIDEGFDFDVIDAHYFYPDGVAAALLARRLGKPLVITARGSDLSFIPRYRWPRRLIRWAVGQADAVITVCSALKDTMVRIGCPDDHVEVLRNGVDLDLFRPPRDRVALRASLDIRGPTLLSVGNLVELKGHHLVIEALKELPGVNLIIVGDGDERSRLERLVADSDLNKRVRFEGVVPQERLRDYYGAADVLVLASSREGWANVLLESMACGTPVVATSVWGTPEVVADDDAGRLVDERSSRSIGQAIRTLLDTPPPRDATRRYAERFAWDPTSDGLWRVFERVTEFGGSATRAMPPKIL